MAKTKLTSWLVFILFVFYNDTYAQSNDDLELLLNYLTFSKSRLKSGQCSQDHNLLGDGTIFQDYSFWDNEIKIANNVANFLTSIWRYKDENNRSLIENEAAIYTLAKTIALSSDQIYGSAVCFDENKFQGKRQFCPYAFKNSTRTNRRIIIRDLGRFNDYLTIPTPVSKGNERFSKDTFIWWHVGKEYLSNAAQLKQNTVHYDTNLDNPSTNSQNVSANRKYYNITSNYIPINYGKWTTPYYDCFGGKTWVITYLVPFYDEADKYLGCVKFDIELDSIEIDQCDAPQTIQTEQETLQFYGAHACRNDTTKCVHVPGGGFKAGNYRCVCRKGFYFPNPNAKKKYFEGRDVLSAKYSSNYSLYDCLPCREGCEECVDDTPCMYQINMSLRTVLLTINETIKALAIALGVFVFVFRESKIIKASSPVFMEIIAFGVVLMYFAITLGYFEDSVRHCIARTWLHHTGFILAFGSLFLKTWRIAVIFRLRTNRVVKQRDTTLLKYLSVMLVAVLCYLMIWTWTQTHESEIKKTTAGYKYSRCVRKWFSNAIEIGEVLLLLCGVWLCLRVRKTPSAYNESKYIAWCIYNAAFIKILVGVLRIVLDNFRNPDVSYVVDFLFTHVVATILLALLFMSKIYLMRKYKKYTQRNNGANSATAITLTDLRQSPFHLNPPVHLKRENDVETTVLGLKTENFQLREENRNLNEKLTVFENKLARESKRLGSSPEDGFKINSPICNSQIVSADGGKESSRDGDAFLDKRPRKRSAAAESTASNESVFVREENSGSLIENIKSAGKQEQFLAVPKQNIVSDGETLTVMSNISNEST